ARVDFTEGVGAAGEFERDGIAASDERKIEKMTEVHAGRSLPRVSTASGSIAIPMRNAIEVRATGVPIVCMRETPAPTRNVMPAAAKRPMDVANAKALPRHSVRYCSGSQSV